MAATSRWAAQGRQATLRAGRIDFRHAEAGFTLIEIVCVLAIIGIVAAIALPAIPRGTSQPQLKAYALQAATLLERDRAAAIRQQRDIGTIVDASTRMVRSGANGHAVRFPADVVMQTVLASHCAGRSNDSTIRHFASGMSCGGVISLTHEDIGYQLRVNWLTGGVDIAAVR